MDDIELRLRAVELAMRDTTADDGLGVVITRAMAIEAYARTGQRPGKGKADAQ